ncbi:MAG: hypothetical protein RPS47_14405 [Colwellia sp.]|jgi:hypothetical protein
MATKNAPFYSVKFNRPETIKSHRSESAAKKTAGDFGMIFVTESKEQFQIHFMSNDTMQKFKAGTQGFEDMDFTMQSALEKENLI